jgi:hypothetical protein
MSNRSGYKSGYNLYSAQARVTIEEAILLETPHIRDRELFRKIGQQLGIQWKALSPEEKAVYTSKADQYNKSIGLDCSKKIQRIKSVKTVKRIHNAQKSSEGQKQSPIQTKRKLQVELSTSFADDHSDLVDDDSTDSMVII